MVGVAPSPGSIHLGSSFDPIGRRLFLSTGPSGPSTSLTTISVTTSATTQVSAPDIFGFLEYDPVTGLVYAAKSSGIVGINPATGAMVSVAPSPGSIHVGSSFDPIGRRLFLATGLSGPSTTLTTISVTTGATTQVSAPDIFGFLEYDSLTGLVYAATSSGIVGISPITGAMVNVAPSPGSIHLGSSFDPIGRRLFLATGPSGPSTSLTTISVTTGATTQVPAPDTFGFLEFAPVAIPVPATSLKMLIPLAILLAAVAVQRLSSSY